MSDVTVYAEALIAAVARAFYEDDAVCIIDVLLRDKYLRDDDMAPRLSLPAKQLRRTLQLLQEEHLVKYELVDDLSSGGSQQTKFWYIDYNHAMNVIRLRIFLLRKKLEEAELRARSQSFYFCPGYKTKACNGRYTETEAQQLVDYDTGLFLCQQCYKTHENNPNPPPRESYTLQLVDNTKDLNGAIENIRRLNSQLSAKRIGNQQLRVGIYDLLQKVRSGQRGPISSNLPSENRAMGIGSKRLAGTGRTASIKAKKLAQQLGYVADKIEGTAMRADDSTELGFLKNANGEKVTIALEKGAASKALLLCSSSNDKAAIIDVVTISSAEFLRRGESGLLHERKRLKREGLKQKASSSALPEGFSFLQNNIGRLKENINNNSITATTQGDEEDDDEVENQREDSLFLSRAENRSDEERRTAFLTNYSSEIERQRSLLKVFSNGTTTIMKRLVDEEEDCDLWEDA